MRIFLWSMVVIGGATLAFYGYQWWGGINVAVKDPEVAVKIADDWKETKQEPSLTSVEQFSGENIEPAEEEELIVEKEFQPIPDKYLRPNQLSQSEEHSDSEDQEDQNNEKKPNESQENENSEGENNTNVNQQNQDTSETQPKQTTSNDTTEKQPTKQPSRKKTPPNSSSDLKIGSVIGQLIIPKIGAYLPIVEGTDPNSLEKGVGKYRGYGTVAPDQTGHVVLSGHRDTVFRKVGKLVNGDKMYVKYKNRMYTYQIRKTWITHAKDRTVIVPINRPVLTVTTCYPFDYVGDAPDRYIIRADLIKIQKV